MDKLTKEEVQSFAMKNNIILTEEELSFTYTFVKKNWEMIIRNPNLLQFDRFKDKFSTENFAKIQKIYQAYKRKASRVKCVC